MMPETARLSAALADRYRIERQLGAGGMATVYVAHDLKHQREVALKVLRPELAAVLGTERFLHEIRITARLDHPHILTLIDSGEALVERPERSEGPHTFLYYVLPLVRGESLRHRLQRERQLSLEEALAITRQIAGALEYAHRQGVVHRDIKPENILLHEGEAMLTDFGIALAVREAGGNRLTESGLSLGTPQYMSPEQATGDRELDARSDVYSLGAVLYEMLAGEPPVTGPTARAMIAKLMTERPTRLRVVRDTVPDGVEHAVAKALAKVPADRFGSAADFARALSLPEAVSSPRGAPRRWIPVALVGVLLLALGLALWIGRRSRPAPIAAFTPQFEQLTTDGNARYPRLSPDGTRLAYVARDCDQQERCTDRLVVRDIGGAGSITVLRFNRIQFLNWAGEGRFLVSVVSDPGGRGRTVAVSALGGTLWSLPGSGVGIVGETDTVFISPALRPFSDSVSWIRIVTIGDGLARDSIALRRPALFQVGFPAPTGGHVALANGSLSGVVIYLLDRSGRTLDSLPRLTTLRAIRWTPRADGLLFQLDLGGGVPQFGEPGSAPVPSVLVRYRVSPAGKFLGGGDTLMRLEPGSQFAGMREDGSALLTRGPVEAVVYALERSGPGRLDFRSRRLESSTAGLQARLSRDGATVWLKRGGMVAGSPRRDGFIPFEGGSERFFNLPPGDEISSDWTRPVSTALLYAVRDSGGKARLIEVSVRTGQSRDIADLPPQTPWVFAVPGGGYGVPDLGSNSARIVGRPGTADTTWRVANIPGRLLTAPGDVTSDGTAFLEFSQGRQADTIWIRRVPLDGGARSAFVPVLGENMIAVLPDGSYETTLRDSTGGLGWYRMPPGSNRSVRLGDAPLQGTGMTWTGSEDGRRFIVVKPVDRPDVFLIENFGDALKR